MPYSKSGLSPSLIVHGMPSNDPIGRPAARLLSDFEASSKTWVLRTGIAFSVSPCRSYCPTRCRHFATSSTDVVLPEANACRNSPMLASTMLRGPHLEPANKTGQR
jgi:hypothetical protein